MGKRQVTSKKRKESESVRNSVFAFIFAFILGSIPKREEPGKTGAPCVKVPGSSRVPCNRSCSNKHTHIILTKLGESLCNRSCSNKTHTHSPLNTHLKESCSIRASLSERCGLLHLPLRTKHATAWLSLQLLLDAFMSVHRYHESARRSRRLQLPQGFPSWILRLYTTE
jgi:hypothetical protein